MEKLAQMANINWYHDGVEVSIWPKDGSRGEQCAVHLSRNWNDRLSHVHGAGHSAAHALQSQHRVRAAHQGEEQLDRGRLAHQALSTSLEAETPGGDWSSSFIASPPDVVVVSGPRMVV
jgi:hypothetical protein